MRRVIDAIFVLGLGQGVVLLCGIATVKIMATVAGPSAIGAFSLIRGLQQTCTAVGSFGSANWIVQGIASRGTGAAAEGFARAAWWITSIASAAILVVALFLDPAIVFGTEGEAKDVFSRTVVYWLALAAALGILLNFFRAWLLARLRTGKVTRVNAVTGLVAVVLAWPVARSMGTGDYALGAVLLAASLGFGFASAALHCLRLAPDERPRRLIRRPTAGMLGSALRIALPTLAVYGIGTITIFLLRLTAAQQLGISAAGIFDAAWTLSTIGLGLLLTTMSNYLLPATGAEHSQAKRILLFEASLRIVTFIAIPLIVAVICTKGVLVRIFYSGEFLPATDMLRWMLIGDYLKITAWLLATAAYARGHILAYGIVETIWSITAFALSAILAERIGSIEGFGMAYLAAYVAYFLAWIIYATRRGFFSVSRNTSALWIAGFLLVAGVSAAAWDVQRVGLQTGAVIVLVTVAFMLLASRKSERVAIIELMRNPLKGLR